jgi:hypothetical protein
VRLLVERVTVEGHEDREQVEVTSHGAGGVTSAHRVRRPGARDAQLSKVTALGARLEGLRQAGPSVAQSAAHWNRAGCSPPPRTERFTEETVARLLSRRGCQGPRPRAMAPVSVLRPYEYWLAD